MKRLSISLALLFSLPVSSLAAIDRSAADEPEHVTVRGRVVCLDESGRRLESKADCNRPSIRFGFDGADGKFYTFLSTDTMTAILTDERVRERELQIVAQPRPNNRLEIIKVRSIREGKLYDIYYYCEVCHVTAYWPGLCPCCRQEMEFKETLP